MRHISIYVFCPCFEESEKILYRKQFVCFIFCTVCIQIECLILRNTAKRFVQFVSIFSFFFISLSIYLNLLSVVISFEFVFFSQHFTTFFFLQKCQICGLPSRIAFNTSFIFCVTIFFCLHSLLLLLQLLLPRSS